MVLASRAKRTFLCQNQGYPPSISGCCCECISSCVREDSWSKLPHGCDFLSLSHWAVLPGP